MSRSGINRAEGTLSRRSTGLQVRRQLTVSAAESRHNCAVSEPRRCGTSLGESRGAASPALGRSVLPPPNRKCGTCDATFIKHCVRRLCKTKPDEPFARDKQILNS